MFKFEKPNYKITEYLENNYYGKFELEPLEKGFGTTLGNALRRVMLSSLPGVAITSVKIEGVLHEFQTIDGVVEDVSTIILNLKNVVLKNHSDEDKVLRLNVSKVGVITAKDIEHDADIEIVNPDQEIATLVKGGSLEMEMTIGLGKGFNRAEDNKKLLDETKLGFIAIDSLFSPIERVSYEVESARIGQDANYDKLILNVWTNGSLTPEEAVALSGRVLIEHLDLIVDLNNIANVTGLLKEEEIDPKLKTLETSIDDLDLSVRAYNCLKRANIHTLNDLTSKTEVEMNKIRNLGKKSLKEVMDKVYELDLNFKEVD
jgi:DNA-directed RNA polymerase subunit alpha